VILSSARGALQKPCSFCPPAPESDSGFRLAPGSFTKLENLIFDRTASTGKSMRRAFGLTGRVGGTPWLKGPTGAAIRSFAAALSAMARRIAVSAIGIERTQPLTYPLSNQLTLTFC
jgi:hypothetical protein